MNLIDDPELEKAFQHFCRHLVGLTVTYQFSNSELSTPGKDNFLCISGIVFASHDRWYWTTAGHALKELDDNLENGKIKLVSSVLVDYFHTNTFNNIPIPFDYKNSQRMYIFDEKAGLDFGLIALRPIYKDLLRNNKIVPLAEENWNYSKKITFDQFILLGLPEQYIEVSDSSKADSHEYIVNVFPTMIYLEPIDYQLREKTDFNRFVAKISKSHSLNSLVGTSGGPIFGFSNDYKDRYWIVAIQNSWLPESKIILGCPISVFAPLAEGIIADLESDLII